MLRRAKILETDGKLDEARIDQEAGLALLESTFFGNALITAKIMDLQATDPVEAERLRLKTLNDLQDSTEFITLFQNQISGFKFCSALSQKPQS